MVTRRRLHRSVQRGDCLKVLRDLQSNGLPLPDGLVWHLAQSPPAVNALVCRRTIELTYGPDEQLLGMIWELINSQMPRGGWQGPTETDWVATAAAISVLGRASRDWATTGLVEQHQRQAIERAYHLAVDALAAQLDQATPIERALHSAPSNNDHAAMVAMVAYMLAEDRFAVEKVGLASVITWLEEHVGPSDRQVQALVEMARLTMRSHRNSTGGANRQHAACAVAA